MGNRSGICVAGSILVDKLFQIPIYPPKGELASITHLCGMAPGGALANVILDLAKMDPSLPLYAVGRIGGDEEGNFLRSRLGEHENIHLGTLLSSRKSTAFTFVISEDATKQRTFFCYNGANTELNEHDFAWEALPVKMLHIGYLLLLEVLDQEDETYGTKMARLLAQAQKQGIKTSIDLVSETGGRFQKVVPPALLYTDYCVINELEAQEITGVMLRDAQGGLKTDNMPDALLKMRAMGVREWAVIHCPEGGFGMGADRRCVHSPGFELPDDFIKGTVGAGDAFCAGVLYAAYQQRGLEEAIAFGNAAAVCSLSKEGATDGMRRHREILRFAERFRASKKE